jgi:hypothetical protein
MSTRFVRRSEAASTAVLVVSGFINRRDGKARECPHCSAKWSAELDTEGEPHVWKDGQEAQHSVLDWHGNNVAIECCKPTDAAGRRDTRERS